MKSPSYVLFTTIIKNTPKIDPGIDTIFLPLVMLVRVMTVQKHPQSYLTKLGL